MFKEYLLQNWPLILILLAFVISLLTTVFFQKKIIIRMYILIAAIFGGILYAKTANLTYLAIYFSAIFAFVAVSSFDKFFSKGAVKNGVAGFLYLEMLDASFSFDGVIGAFALSENIFIIMIGLGSGAMFVRSMTIYLVKKGTLAELIYLEHGAHYAILALAVIMFLKIFYEVSEILTGTISFILIALSLFASLKYRKSSLKNLQGD